MNAVGGHISKLRKKTNMTQQALADRLNVTRQAVSQWEHGNTQPDLDTLAAIAGVFGVDMMEVIYGEKREETLRIDPERRKRYLTGLAVFGVTALVMLMLSLFLRPYLIKLSNDEFEFFIIIRYNYYLQPFLYMLICMAVFCGCSLTWDIRIKRGIVRRFIIIGVATFLLFHYVSGLIYLRYMEGIPDWIFHYHIYFFKHDPVVFLLPGVGLFLGLNGHGRNRRQQALSE